MSAARIDSLRCVVLVALDELDALIDADPAAAYANRAVRGAAETLRHTWLPSLGRLGELDSTHHADWNGMSSSSKLKPPTVDSLQ